jgi:2-iminobutanoate/2-iminopropanoate deaminase
LEEEHAVKKETLKPKNLAPPVAPFSHGVSIGNMVFTAGTGPFGADGKLIEGDIKAQTRQVIENIKSILKAGGATLNDIVQATIYIDNFDNYQGMNEVYREYFPVDPPPRATVQIVGMWGGMLVEIMAIAVIPE